MEFIFEKISRKLYIPRPYNWGQKQIESYYRMSNSRICFTSGTVANSIAKYFEIPAAGSVLYVKGLRVLKILV